ncbi:hypothetical protein JCM10908_004553 [Rhodotorula pacifica]|uniref:uncharacterized protein n=1 Tax=Rhodotorula pacifica TaxID=1495444 RepID=UPI00317D1126
MLYAARGALQRLGRRRVSTCRIVPSTADRQLALPLAFLHVQPSGDAASTQPDHPWEDWADRFAQRGYSSLLLHVDASAARTAKTSRDRLEHLEKELLKLLRDPATSSPFPPLMFAAGSTTLLAETYVSSHPLSALCLVAPVPAPIAHKRDPALYPTELDDFDYEPGFPIAILHEAGLQTGQSSPHRLIRDFTNEEDPEDEDGLVRRLVGKRDEQGWQRVMDWMDENGL